MGNKRTIIVMLLFTFFATILYGKEIPINDQFNNLKKWSPLLFPKIKRHSSYSIIKKKNSSYLKAYTNNSASGLINKKAFNIYKTPIVKWRWKIDNVFKKGNARLKSGDDYPIRIYIVFKYNPSKASFIERTKYRTAKLIYGKYPPHSSMNYIWSNKRHNSSMITSAYTKKAKMIVLQSGTKNKGKWITQQVNVLKDYKKAFGENPPASATIAIMSDSDNTKEKANAYIDFIRVESVE